MSLTIVLYDENNEDSELHYFNYTHNISEMAARAGLYIPMWHHASLGITHAWQLRPFLACGLAQLKASPNYYKQFNPPNGWGEYNTFVSALEKLYHACGETPHALLYFSK